MNKRPTINFSSILSESEVPITEERLEEVLKQEVSGAGSLLANDSVMSPFWSWVRAAVIKPVNWLINVLMVQYIMPNMFVATAQRWALELKAWELNVVVKEAVKTQGLITFKKNDADDVVTIKAGTIVETLPIDGVTYQLKVLQDTIIVAKKETGMVLMEAMEPGLAYNLAAGYYNTLPKELPGIGEVVNEANWVTTLGANAETDEELALRLQNTFTAAGNWHVDDTYRSIIAGFAGIRTDNIFFINTCKDKPGTANAYIVMEVGPTPANILASLNSHIMEEGFHGHGDKLTCLAMPDAMYRLEADVIFNENTNTTKQTLALTEVEDRIRAAFRETGAFADMTRAKPFSRFSISLLCTELHQNIDVIKSVKISVNDEIQEDIVSTLVQPRITSLLVKEVISENTEETEDCQGNEGGEINEDGELSEGSEDNE